MVSCYRYNIIGLRFYQNPATQTFQLHLHDKKCHKDFMASPEELLKNEEILMELKQDDLCYLRRVAKFLQLR